MFILDVTISMSGSLNACKCEIRNIINNIRTEFEGIRVRLSIVAFRDFTYDEEDHFEIFPFSREINDCVDFLNKLECKSSTKNDAPEDSLGGLFQGLAQNWKAQNKYAILLTDAPCHGN
mmetsp:Transcript_30136/g.29409  ORF Transcript_30136/g.29409 Transcript_30136/m.29409 type:complete len:119 (-) Transcript_30136:449-805(-)